jgi:hypothetical protein
MTTLHTRTLNTYKQASLKFTDKALSLIPTYDKVPSGEYSSERMGGWVIRDIDNMMIGWVGNLGEINVLDYEPTFQKGFINCKK